MTCKNIVMLSLVTLAAILGPPGFVKCSEEEELLAHRPVVLKDEEYA